MSFKSANSKEALIVCMALDGREDGVKHSLRMLSRESRRKMHESVMDLLYWITEVQCEPAPDRVAPMPEANIKSGCFGYDYRKEIKR